MGDERDLDVLAVGAAAKAVAGLEGFEVHAGTDLATAAARDAVLLHAADADALAALAARPELAQAAFATAVVVLSAAADPAREDALLRLGVQAVALESEGRGALARVLRHAVLRKAVERNARTAYATDLATGLPHAAQLLEHMTQLFALRERQPSPMAVIALRVEGYAAAAARLGGEAANVLRRKVAVRLRGGLRASDVVAAIGPEMFGVLLGHIDAQGDAERVAGKLVRALQQPFTVAGQPCRVGAAVGLALYPLHGKDAAALLQRAVAQAGGVATQSGTGAAHVVEFAAGGAAPPAANDG